MILGRGVCISTLATLFVATVMLFGCSAGQKNSVEHRFYSSVFTLDDSTCVTVLTEKVDGGLVVKNGDESIFVKSQGEGCYSVPVFGGSWVGKWSGGAWIGCWIDSLRTKDYRVKLEVNPLKKLVPVRGGEINSVWDTSLGKFKLRQKGDSAWATFMTSTGDYRYLAGEIDTITSEFKIQNFDGAHLFYFEGVIRGDSITDGVFKSGIHYSTSWSGVRVENEKVKWSSRQEWGRGEKIRFEGINSGGEVEVWSRERLKKSGYKLLVVDVMGTWCPNCLDEARLLQELSLDYPEMLVVSMSFERFKGAEALRRIAGFKESVGISWEILHGGAASKSEADSCLAFFGGVRSFPTTAFIPLEGDPIVHSGFSGPATGEVYEEEVGFFRETIEDFLND
mgnify:FL=1